MVWKKYLTESILLIGKKTYLHTCDSIYIHYVVREELLEFRQEYQNEIISSEGFGIVDPMFTDVTSTQMINQITTQCNRSVRFVRFSICLQYFHITHENKDNVFVSFLQNIQYQYTL